MKLEGHIKKFREHMEGLEWGIKQNNQSAIGFHASTGAIELLSILLHKLDLISTGVQINHAWFRSRKNIDDKLNFNFPHKEKIIFLIENIEDLRNPLCYGTPRPEENVEAVTENFQKLKKLVENILGESFD